MVGTIKKGYTTVQSMGHGGLYTIIPKHICDYNKITKGCIIKWSSGYGFPHIERIIDPVNGHNVKLDYRRD